MGGMSGSSEVTGASSSSVSRRRVMFCDCGVKSPVVTAWQGKYAGRRFFECGLYKVHGKRVCNFFEWYDTEGSERDRKIITTLLKKLHELKIRQNYLVWGLVMSWVIIVILVMLLVCK